MCVVQKVENSTPTQYRVAFAYRSGCRPHTPLLTHPCIYTKGPDFKRFLLTKRALLLHTICECDADLPSQW